MNTSLKAKIMGMTPAVKAEWINNILASTKVKNVYDKCTCGNTCDNRLFLARKDNLHIMQCCQCDKIQVVTR